MGRGNSAILSSEQPLAVGGFTHRRRVRRTRWGGSSVKLVRERERGSATVVSLTLVAALVVLLVLAGTIAGIVQRRAHLQGAADLAALAAAADRSEERRVGKECAS